MQQFLELHSFVGDNLLKHPVNTPMLPGGSIEVQQYRDAWANL